MVKSNYYEGGAPGATKYYFRAKFFEKILFQKA